MTHLFRPQNPLGNARMEPTNGSVDDLIDIIALQKISEPSDAVSCSYFDHNPRPNKRQHTASINWADLDVSDDELKTLTTSSNTKVRPSPQILQPIQEEPEVATFVSARDQPLPFDGMEFHTTTMIADDSYETKRKFLKRRASSLYENDNASQAQAVYKKIYKTLPTFVARSNGEAGNLVRPTPVFGEGIKLSVPTFEPMAQSFASAPYAFNP
jgi:hypothetical protein